MSEPSSFHELPIPHPDVSGRNHRDIGEQKPSKMAERYRPNGAPQEPEVSTVARFAGRLIDRSTGKAHSADEMLASEEFAAALPAAIASDPDAIVDALNGDDDVFPATAFELADTTGLTLPANTIAVNGNGELVMHDGATSGGVALLSTAQRLTSTYFDDISGGAVSSDNNIATFTISDAQATAGTTVHVVGTIKLRFESGAPPASSVIGFTTAKGRNLVGDVATYAVVGNLAQGTALPTAVTSSIEIEVYCNLRFTLTASGGYSGFLYLDLDSDYAQIRTTRYEHSSNGASILNDSGSDLSLVLIADGSGESVQLNYANNAAGAGNCSIIPDLRVTVTAP